MSEIPKFYRYTIMLERSLVKLIWKTRTWSYGILLPK